jgi:organic radical activating enzyme
MSKIRISETFLSLEGEGPLTGRPTFFIRTYGCNLTCSGFSNTEQKEVIYLKNVDHKNEKYEVGCDSAYSWHPAFKDETTDLNINEVVDLIEFHSSKGRMISLTGGEPMLYQDRWVEVFEEIGRRRKFDLWHQKSTSLHKGDLPNILIETNGTISPSDEFLRSRELVNLTFAVSPKLKASGEPREKAINSRAIQLLSTSYQTPAQNYLKFVTSGSEEELAEIEEVLEQFSSSAFTKEDVWLMPMGSSESQQQEVMQVVAQQCIDHGYNFCARVHVWVYGNKKGT